MAQTFLILHLLGAGVIGALILASIVSIFKKQDQKYSRFAKYIGLGAGYQLATGSLLSLAQSDGSLIGFCTRIGLYLAVVVGIETVLFVKMKNLNLAFPLKFVGVPVTASLIFVIVAIINLI